MAYGIPRTVSFEVMKKPIAVNSAIGFYMSLRLTTHH